MEMSSIRIPVMKPSPVRAEFLGPRIRSIAAAGIFSNRGPQLLELESRLAEWLGVSKTKLVIMSNATVGLIAAVALSPAKSWHVPAWSFPATVLAPLQNGKSVTFVDIDDQSWLVRDERDDSSIGLVNVIPFGGFFDQTAWSGGGELVVDAAASLGTRPSGLRDLPDSVTVVFSLHATKTMGGAEGGVVVFGSEERADLARSWINFGFSRERESIVVGTNGKMSEYDAAAANARLDGWEEEAAGWEKLRNYTAEATGYPPLERTPEWMSSINPYWIALFRSADDRGRVRKQLEKAGIETRLWWGEGLHKMLAFSSVPRKPLLVVEDLASRYLGLPFHLSLSSEHFEEITKIIKSSI